MTEGPIITTKKGFVYFDYGKIGGTNNTWFYIKDNADCTSHSGSAKKSFNFDNFGGAPDKFLLNQLQEPIICDKYKIQDINSILCGSLRLYFLYLILRMD